MTRPQAKLESFRLDGREEEFLLPADVELEAATELVEGGNQPRRRPDSRPECCFKVRACKSEQSVDLIAQVRIEAATRREQELRRNVKSLSRELRAENTKARQLQRQIKTLTQA